MNMYQTLLMRHSRDVYKRGQFKGDAPADPSRRGKNHFRIVKRGEDFGIIFHNTQIITVYPNGLVKLCANGWESSPTTRQAFSTMGFLIRTQANNGYRNTMVARYSALYDRRGYRSGHTGEWYVFYDDMVLDSNGVLLGDHKPQYKYVSDRAARKEFDTDAAEFRKLVPLLLATSLARLRAASDRLGDWEARWQARYVRDRTDQILQLGMCEQYADLVDAWNGYSYPIPQSGESCPKKLWSSIRASCVRKMTVIVEVSA